MVGIEPFLKLGAAALLALAAVADVRAQEAGATPPLPVVLDRIVAVVGERLIMASDVALEAEFQARSLYAERLLLAREGEPLEALIDAAVIRGLAGEVALYKPPADDVRARVERLRSSWDDPAEFVAFLARNGLDDETLSSAVYARMAVERYVHRNVGLASTAAGDDAAQARARYLAWITAARETVSIRRVDARFLPGEGP